MPFAEEFRRGLLVFVGLDPVAGHEQRGTRPCVIVSDPAIASDQRYPLVAIVPISRTPGKGALYPRLAAGSGGLRKRSYALVDQVRSVGKRRVVRAYGLLSPEEMDQIDEGLELFLGIR